MILYRPPLRLTRGCVRAYCGYPPFLKPFTYFEMSGSVCTDDKEVRHSLNTKHPSKVQLLKLGKTTQMPYNGHSASKCFFFFFFGTSHSSYTLIKKCDPFGMRCKHKRESKLAPPSERQILNCGCVVGGGLLDLSALPFALKSLVFFFFFFFFCGFFLFLGRLLLFFFCFEIESSHGSPTVLLSQRIHFFWFYAQKSP